LPIVHGALLKVRVVQEIKRLNPELQTEPFVQPEAARYAQIQVAHSRSAKGIEPFDRNN